MGHFATLPPDYKPHDSWSINPFSCVKSQVVVRLKPKVGNALDVARKLQSQVDHAYLGMAAPRSGSMGCFFQGVGVDHCSGHTMYIRHQYMFPLGNKLY